MWLNSPAERIDADGVSLSGGFSPEAVDQLLVVSIKRHVDRWLWMPNWCGIYIQNRARAHLGHHPRSAA